MPRIRGALSLYFLLSRYIVEGVSPGSVKG